MHSIILCGGSGTRLWPLSRKNFPKQFLSLDGNKSLIQETFLRFCSVMPPDKIIFVTNKENYYNVLNQIKEIENNFDARQIIIEPASLNTLPAAVCAIKYLVEKKRVSLGEPIIISPADHYVKDREFFSEIIKKAAREIGKNMGTIGIRPAKAETGYGYIKKGESLSGFFKVAEFKEKPDKETAIKYLESGDYLWNSGIYIFKIKTFLQELKKYAPEIYSLLISPEKIFLENFKNLPAVSIDVAISEKSDRMVVFEEDFGWSDVGSFDSLSEILADDKNKKHISIDSKNIFIHSAGNRLIATLGVDDLIIIETSDGILIQKRGRSEDVRKIVKHLEENNLKEAEHNLVVHRPWGKYEVLIDELGVKAKKITVYPGAKLSLQSHLHRAEHWVVVSGVAKIVNGENNLILKENESTFIPAFSRHRLENPGKFNLEIIEVQTGKYVEEDDIIRFEDVYKR